MPKLINNYFKKFGINHKLQVKDKYLLTQLQKLLFKLKKY